MFYTVVAFITVFIHCTSLLGVVLWLGSRISDPKGITCRLPLLGPSSEALNPNCFIGVKGPIKLFNTVYSSSLWIKASAKRWNCKHKYQKPFCIFNELRACFWTVRGNPSTHKPWTSCCLATALHIQSRVFILFKFNNISMVKFHFRKFV